jgi:hypothetical protein
MLQIQENICDTYQGPARSHLHDTFCTSFSWFCPTFNKVPDRIVRHFCFACTPTSQCPSTLGSSEVCVGRWNWHRLVVCYAPCSPEHPCGRRCYNTRLQRHCVVNIEPTCTLSDKGLRTVSWGELNHQRSNTVTSQNVVQYNSNYPDAGYPDRQLSGSAWPFK